MALPTNIPNPNSDSGENKKDTAKSPQGLPTVTPPQRGLPIPNVSEKPTGLPKLPLPNTTTAEPIKPPKTQQRPSKPAPPKPERRRKQPKVADEIPEGYAKDPKTGKVYKLLPGASKEAIAAAKRNGGGFTSISDLRKFVKEEDEFNMDDLNGMAEQFMSHLRVPPSPQELERLRREREERLKRDLENAIKETPELYQDTDDS